MKKHGIACIVFQVNLGAWVKKETVIKNQVC